MVSLLYPAASDCSIFPCWPGMPSQPPLSLSLGIWYPPDYPWRVLICSYLSRLSPKNRASHAGRELGTPGSG